MPEDPKTPAGESAQTSGAALPEDVAADADALIADIASPPMAKAVLIAVAVHLVLILVTSVHFLILCGRHGTMDPRAVISQLKQEEREAQEAAQREAARKAAPARRASRQAKTPPKAKTAKPSKTTPGLDPKSAAERAAERELGGSLGP